MNFKKQLFNSLKRYLEGTIEREKLNEELGSLHSKIIEPKEIPLAKTVFIFP